MSGSCSEFIVLSKETYSTVRIHMYIVLSLYNCKRPVLFCSVYVLYLVYRGYFTLVVEVSCSRLHYVVSYGLLLWVIS